MNATQIMSFTHVDRLGSNGTGCSLNATCCSTMSTLLVDLNKDCDSLATSQAKQIVIDVKSDFSVILSALKPSAITYQD